MGVKSSSSNRRSRRRKGSLEETISFAMHSDDPENYIVFYRDKDTMKEATLRDYMEGEDYSAIPLTRIVRIKRRGGEDVWIKGQKEVLVKKGSPS
jgi:uncharacterized protein (UPF0248 family)